MQRRPFTLQLARTLGWLWLISLSACGDENPAAPPAMQTISGHVLYCGSSNKWVAGVIVHLETDGNVHTDTTDASGAFLFDDISSLVSERQWGFSKETTSSDRTAVTEYDATLLYQSVEGITVFDGCSLLAADVNEDDLVDIDDAMAVSEWLLQNPEAQRTGTWTFKIAPGAIGSEAELDIGVSALILGDVNLSWTSSP